MRQKKILKDTSDWLSGYGICSVITNLFDVPWKDTTSGVDLDLDYYANRSQNKQVSNLVELMLDDNGELSNEDLVKLATITYRKYGASWDRAFLAFSKEYNPIHNYNGDETYTDVETMDSDKSTSLSRSETVLNTGTQTDSGSRTNTGTQTDEESIEYKGSESDSGSKTNTGTQTDEGSKTNTGTQTDEGSIEYKGSESDSGSKTNTGTQTSVEDTTDNTTFGFGTGTNAYKETTTYGKTDTSTKSFPTTRKSTKTIDGEYTDTHDNSDNGYKVESESYAKQYVQNRSRSFDSDKLVARNDSETLSGVGNDGSTGAGASGSPGSSNTNKTTQTTTGSYTDKREYGTNNNNYTEEIKEEGSEQDLSSLSGSDVLTLSGSKTENEDKDSTVTRTDNLSESTSNTHSFTNRKDEKSNTRTDNLSESTSNTRTDNLSQATTGSDTGTEALDYTKELSHEFHREGNYGVRTTQEMLEQEIELRQKYSSLFDCIVFPDIDKVMTIGVFKGTHLY